MRIRRRIGAPLTLGLLVLVLATALSSPVAGAESRLFVGIDYRPDATLEGCPSESAFRAMISAELGYDPFRTHSELKVVARTQATERGSRGFVEWHDASGTLQGVREIGSERGDCASIAKAMSFAIAVQIQLLGQEAKETAATTAGASPGSDASSPDGTPELPGKRSPGEVDRDRKSPARSSDSDEGWQFLAGAGPAISYGLAPRTAVEVRVFGAARRDWLALELGAEASLPARHATRGDEGFEQRTVLGSLAGCALIHHVLSGCLVGKVGTVRVRGFGVDEPRSPAGVVTQVGPRLTVSQRLSGRWVGRLHVEALMSLVPWKVTLNRRDVWETRTFGLVVGADLAALFE